MTMVFALKGMCMRPRAVRLLLSVSLISPQAIYHLEHAMLGAMEVFLVPIGRDPEGIRYEAIFN